MTHIQSKKFYKDANSMQKGWGDYLLWIDRLKDKKQYNGMFTTRQFCWTLYGDGHCSQVWLSFQQEFLKKGIKVLRYKKWEQLFNDWNKQ